MRILGKEQNIEAVAPFGGPRSSVSSFLERVLGLLQRLID